MLVRTEHSQAHTHRHGTPGAGIKDASKTITRPAYRCHRAAVFSLHADECAKTALPPVHDAQGDFFFGSSEDGHSCVPKPPPAPTAWSFRGGLSDALGHGGRLVPGAAAAAGPRSRGTSSGLGTHLCESSRFVASLLMLQSFMAAVDARERPASASPACAACRW